MTLAAGTTTVPTVVGVAADAAANVVVTPAASLPGTTTIKVTAEDGTTIITYTIYFDVDTWVEPHKGAGIAIYPTVSDSYFKVITPGAGIVTVHDITGKLVQQQNSESNEQSLTIQQAGIYFVTVDCDGVSKTFKVVKTR